MAPKVSRIQKIPVAKIAGWTAFSMGVMMMLSIIALIVAMETGLYQPLHAGWLVLIPFAGLLAYALIITPVAVRYSCTL
ncbi:MAG: hypothetical protein AAB927_01090 [Patescibacteria group bacterium]